MKRLLGYLKEHLCVTILAPLFKMLEASFELFVPLVVASMIDVGIGHHDIGYLWKMGGLLILLGIIGFSFSITAQYFAARSAVYTGKSMRSDLFAHMNQFSYQEIDQVGTSTLINRMSNDINQVQNGVNMFLRLFLRSPFVVFGAMFMAFTVDHKAAVSFVFTITALAVVVGLILWITMPMYKKVQKQVDGVLKSTRENLLGIRVIRAFNRQRSEEENFRLQSRQLYSKQIHVGKISLTNPVIFPLVCDCFRNILKLRFEIKLAIKNENGLKITTTNVIHGLIPNIKQMVPMIVITPVNNCVNPSSNPSVN